MKLSPAADCSAGTHPVRIRNVMRTPITIVIPTLNEAAQIAECIGQLAWAAEVIVVDGGSSDDTTAQARAAGARVLEAKGGTIAGQRNAGIAQAAHPWVFAVDADERVTPELAQELDRVVRAPAHEAYRVKRRNVLHGRVVTHGRWGRDWVVRLFKRERRYVERKVHEGLEPVPDIGALEHELVHVPYRDLAHHVQKMVVWSRLGAEELAAQGRRAGWSDLTVRPALRLWRELLINGALWQGAAGAASAGMGAVGVFLKYLFLWDLNRRSDG